MNKITINTLRTMKAQKEKFSVLTAYDASFSRLLAECEIEVVLVGDSLGNVIQGHGTTVPVTMDAMVYHTNCVSRTNDYSLIIADLPYMAYATPEQAMANATRLMQAGANMVKLEGGDWLLETVAMLNERGVPVCGHLGLTPQSVDALGGFKVQGRNEDQAAELASNAQNLADAGADLIVFECIPSLLGQSITESLSIPTIGIGAGAGTDAQVLVLHDALGISVNKIPKFAKNFMLEADTIEAALRAYKSAVSEGSFPASEHGFN